MTAKPKAPAKTAEKKSLDEPVIGKQDLGYGNKYKNSQGRTHAVGMTGRTQQRQEKKREYITTNVAGTSGARAEKPAKYKLVTPEDLMAVINSANKNRGRLVMSLEGQDWKSLGFRERKKDETHNQWVASDDTAERIFLFWALGVPMTELWTALKVSPWIWMDLRLQKPLLYKKAKELRAQLLTDAISGDIIAVESMKLPPDYAAILLRQRSWLAGKMDSASWGEKSTTEHTGAGGGPIKIDQTAVDMVKSKLLGGS